MEQTCCESSLPAFSQTSSQVSRYNLSGAESYAIGKSVYDSEMRPTHLPICSWEYSSSGFRLLASVLEHGLILRNGILEETITPSVWLSNKATNSSAMRKAVGWELVSPVFVFPRFPVLIPSWKIRERPRNTNVWAYRTCIDVPKYWEKINIGFACMLNNSRDAVHDSKTIDRNHRIPKLLTQVVL